MNNITIVDPSGRSTVVKRPESLVSLKTLATSSSGLGFSKNTDLDRLALTYKGKAIECDDDVCRLKDGDIVLCFVRPRHPPRISHQQDEEEEDQVSSLERDVDGLFVIRKGAIPEYIKSLLIHSIGIPEWVVAPMTHITKRQACWFLLWCSLSRVSYKLDLGPIFILGTIFYFIFSNLGTRTGEFSAYSIFNRGVRRLPGDQLDADHIRRTGFGAM